MSETAGTSDGPPPQPPPGWYNTPPGSYGAPPPPPQYGAPQDQYGAPQGSYGTPPPGWDGPPSYGQHQPYGWPPQPHGGASGDDTIWAVLGHLSAFVSLPILVPLVIYLVKKDTSPFVRHHAAEALNFHITMTIASFVAALLLFVLIGFVLLPALVIFVIIVTVLAAVAAGKGEPYRYPLSIRFLS
ncbi:MAG: DUF4870 domain-containing protein [Actinomycetota bacterium]|nr:DUF4870 domain-containing protein [Actinomycetota bacterium]